MSSYFRFFFTFKSILNYFAFQNIIFSLNKENALSKTVVVLVLI